MGEKTSTNIDNCKYLCVDTASANLSIMVGNGKETDFFSESNFTLASQILLEKIDELLTKNNLTLGELDFFAVNIGSGSFTGIRIGLATIKAFAFCCNKKVVCVNSNQILAYTIKAQEYDYIVTVVDGHSVYYVGVYDGNYKQTCEATCMTAENVDELLRSLGGNKVALVVERGLSGVFDGAIKPLDDCTNLKQAVLSEVSNSRYVGSDEVEPLYIRKAQAERKEGDL